MIYRGYDIDRRKDGGYDIKLDGKFVCQQPSEEFAQSWVDQERRNKAQNKEKK